MSSMNGKTIDSIERSNRFVTREQVAEKFKGKSVAVVGSAPSVVKNKKGFIDSHDIVVRVNNYKLFDDSTGHRTDIFYSFFGTSIRKQANELQRDGVSLCMCKLPDSRPLESEWHTSRNKDAGIDYRYIYRNRAAWWFCDTYIPTTEVFMEKFELLGKHQPTTGFSALLDILSFDCQVYVTGFDFFTSGLHNVDERWRVKNLDDPIRHMPDLEAQWLSQFAKKNPDQLIPDGVLREILQ